MKFPFVISVPHCSSRIPRGLRPHYVLRDEEIRESEDAGTREIFGAVPAAAVLCASWSRLVVDLNRGPDQKGPMGIIPEMDYFERSLYAGDGLPDEKERRRRLKVYYRPYHERLKAALGLSEVKVLFDCHSLNGTGPPGSPDPGARRKDIVLGNNGGPEGDEKPSLGHTTCPPEMLKGMKTAFQEAGFSVSLNTPYSGGFITTRYGHEIAGKGKAAVQIEINQDLFLIPGTHRADPVKIEVIRKKIFQSFDAITTDVLERQTLVLP